MSGARACRLDSPRATFLMQRQEEKLRETLSAAAMTVQSKTSVTKVSKADLSQAKTGGGALQTEAPSTAETRTKASNCSKVRERFSEAA